MRMLLAALAVLAGIGPLAAAEVTAPSKIDAVIVFPAGAEVRRIAKVKLESGEHTILFNDLPQQAVQGSVRVEGKATGQLEIGSVDTRRISVPRLDPQVAASNRKRIEDEIERLKDEQARYQAEQQVAQAQKSFLTNLVQLPSRNPPPAPAVAGTREDWSQVLGLIAKELPQAHKAALDAGIKMRETARRIRELEQQLKAEGPALQERTEVKVFVSVRAPLEADLAISYQVPDAFWSALYDARLATGSRTAPPKLTLTRRASITQRTSEPWERVSLSLSTTRPAAGSTAPELKPITVDFPSERPVAAAAPPPAQAQARRAAPASGESAATQYLDQALKTVSEEAVDAFERKADVDVTAFQAVFVIAGRVTIPNTGEAKRVQIDEVGLEPALVVRTVPRVEARAFLYAKLSLPKSAPYLPGPVALFRDQTFVGTGRLPALAPGEDYELGFGGDDLVRVRSAVVEEKRGESGLISSQRTETRSYRITIKNLHERQVGFSVQDQIPVASNQDIKVEFTGRTQPTKRDVDDRRGVLAWEDKLNPDEERAIEFGYRVVWPGGKSIVYGR